MKSDKLKMEKRAGKLTRKKAITRLLLIIALLVCTNLLSSLFHTKWDVTAEKRFSLSEPTRKLLKSLKDDITIEVYLKGNFPAGFQRLSEATREILQQFREFGGNHIHFRFLNPFEDKNDQEKEKVLRDFSDKGILFTKLQIQQDAEEGYSEKIIFPSALVSNNQRRVPVSLLENHISMSPSEKLNISESQLEYKLASSIRYLLQPDKKKIAYITGNGQALGPGTYDILKTLEQYYDLDTLDLNQQIEISPVYTAALICQPTLAFDDKQKFKIDQYVTHGGRLVWMIDQLRFDVDSLRTKNAGLALDYGLNLDDLLFNYGTRVNSDFVEDYQQVNPLAITVGMINNNPDIRLLPFPYFPFSIPDAKHAIVRNMDAIMFLFANSIDTIANPEIRKTILLHSSNRSRRLPAPVRVSLGNLQYAPKPEMFKEKNIPMAVLLEGRFQSIYTNRLDPNFLTVYRDSLKKEFIPVCTTENKMIVISDGDIMQNDYSESKGPMECGYYKYTGQHFANKTFLLNCLEYLTDNSGLLEARNKDLQLRLLDRVKIKKEKFLWQFVNIAVPIALILFFGSAYFFFRRKKYEGRI